MQIMCLFISPQRAQIEKCVMPKPSSVFMVKLFYVQSGKVQSFQSQKTGETTQDLLLHINDKGVSFCNVICAI